MRAYEASYRVRTYASGMNHGTGGSTTFAPFGGQAGVARGRAPPSQIVPARPGHSAAAHLLEAVL